MMNASPNAPRELFVAALKLAPEQWPAYLNDACGQDVALRARVKKLLAAHLEAGSFLKPVVPGHDATLDDSTGDRPGGFVGPYKLLQQIGEGGMGTVFLAEQTRPVERKVAVKIIRPGMASRHVIARFEAERQALALMDHPNIAKVLDASTSGGRPYFVMELVKGVPITKYCDEHQLTPRQRLELFVPVCQAVQHAHQKGIIHRDLKPSNVMICLYDGKPVPKVIDFGVAKATGQKPTDRTVFTEIGQVVGTLEYMSPEQAELNQLDVDTRSDIYSLGVLLYELLTGSTPLDTKRLKTAPMLEVLRLIREEEPPRPSTRLSTTVEMPSVAAKRGVEPKKLSGLIRGELDWIVMKALEKDRNRRYESANGFAMDIQRYLADEPVLACPPSARYRLRKFVRRNKGPVTAAALLLLALMGGMVATTWQAIRATRAESDAVGQKTAALEAQGAALREADRNRRLLYSADVHVASQVWQSEEGTVAQCNELLLAHVPEPGQPDLREFSWRYQWRLLHRGSVVRLPVVPRAVGVAAGDRVVALDESGKVHGWRIGDRTAPDEWALASGGMLGVTLARNGEIAAVIDRDGSPKVIDTRTGLQKVVIRAPSALVNLKLSADGGFLVGVGRDNHARVWDAASGKELYDYLMIDPTARQIDLSLDGKQLLASSGANATLLVLYRAGQAKPTVLQEDLEASAVGGFNKLQGALSPDGKLAAVASAGNAIDLYDTATGKVLRHLRSRSRPLRVVFSADGTQLAAGEKTGVVTVWRLPRPVLPDEQHQAAPGPEKTAATQPVARNFKGHLAAIEALAFTADGRKLVSIGHDHTARCWDVDEQEESRVLEQGRGQIDGLSYSPDGRYLALASMGNGIWVHDLTSRDAPRLLTTRGSRRVALSPDGRTIAGGPDHRVTLWDAKTSGVLATLSEPEPAEIGAMAYSPDGHWLVVGAGGPNNFGADSLGKVMIFDVANRKLHRTVATPTQVSAVAFSRDGKLLAAAGHNGTVWLWDAASWDEIRRWQGPGGTLYSTVQFLSGDRELAAGSHSGRIDLLDVKTAKLARQIQGHIDCVSAMTLSPDGRTLATASWDRSIKLWDSATGRALRTLFRESEWMYALTFSPDGNTLASGGLSTVLRLWEASSLESVAADLAEVPVKGEMSRP
jgi:WD40 repeat protein/serine/threonine protein kinase